MLLGPGGKRWKEVVDNGLKENNHKIQMGLMMMMMKMIMKMFSL